MFLLSNRIPPRVEAHCSSESDHTAMYRVLYISGRHIADGF